MTTITQKNKIAQNYHDIFIPTLDIYRLSGPSVFRSLERPTEGEKNLIVIPLNFIRALGSQEESTYGFGGEEVLDFLKKLSNSSTSSSGENLKLYTLSDSADIAIIDQKEIRDPTSILPDLEQKIKTIWPNFSQKPAIITSDPVTYIEFKDTNFRVESPEFLIVNKDIVNEGIISGNDTLLARLMENKITTSEQAADILKKDDLRLNQFIRFLSNGERNYARVTGTLKYNNNNTRITGVTDKKVILLNPKENGKRIKVGTFERENVLGISPNDMEQYLAMQYGLLNPDISLFFLCGSQGSGKTLLSYVAAVDQILYYKSDIKKQRSQTNNFGDNKLFKQIILLKPNEILGGARREIGFLPGSVYDKIRPHLAPYEDAHKESDLAFFSFDEMIRHPRYDNEFGPVRKIHTAKEMSYQFPDEREMIHITYSGFLRGRSFSDSMILLDEAQNFTPSEVKNIISRLGTGCKCIIMGDPDQTDNPFCSREINGLTHAIKHYIDTPYTALVKLSKNYRSQMSKESDSWKVYATK